MASGRASNKRNTGRKMLFYTFIVYRSGFREVSREPKSQDGAGNSGTERRTRTKELVLDMAQALLRTCISRRLS
jgi:hypothetical protein